MSGETQPELPKRGMTEAEKAARLKDFDIQPKGVETEETADQPENEAKKHTGVEGFKKYWQETHKPPQD